MSTENDLSLSQLSLNSTISQGDDWDRSFVQQDGKGDVGASLAVNSQMRTPRSSVIFPSPIEDNQRTPGKRSTPAAKRPLSELLRMHAEKGTDVKCSPEDASRLAEVLGQWINSFPSPYEGDDDFFGQSQDDSSLPDRTFSPDMTVRPRGQSESCLRSRPPSATGVTSGR